MDDISKLVAALSPKKRALLAQALGVPVAASANEPIAIVGMSCRFPGAPGLEDYWQLLSNGVDAIREVPAERWNASDFYDPSPDAAGKMISRWGGFLDRVDLFDAGFFGISPHEAHHMDPQQRLLLEVAWEALEDAGQTQEGLGGSRTGVFVGCGRFDYALGAFPNLAALEGYDNTGNMLHAVAGRLSYLLNLRGPVMSIDTACSSSLVATHLACQSLRQGEADMAVAAGVNVILRPSLSIAISKAGALSPEGRCKTFDAGADGYVRGEGCGVVVLKRLSDALAAGDSIYALIRGSATNHSGRSSGFTVPNVRAQQEVFRGALANAGLQPADVGYIEAHGTGTSLGDPIEMEAVMSVYGEGRPPGRPFIIGSAKTNLGHLEPAAGVAGLIKAALALHRETIPPHLNFKSLNPNIAPSDAFLIPTRATPWPRDTACRRAAVSSFGISGVNAHVVLEEAPKQEMPEGPASSSRLLLPLSARSKKALQAMAASYREFLVGRGRASRLEDLVFTAAKRRTHHEHRLAVPFSSREDLIERLDAFANGEARQGMSSGQPLGASQPKLAFVFCGQGPQWWGMGRQLISEDRRFREFIERCDAIIKKLGRWSLLEELSADEASSRLSQTEVAQPALFAIQAALTELWRRWGIEPDAVVGHSVGEIAAAYVAGVVDLDQAVGIAFHRGRIMQRAGGRGRMAAIGLPLADVRSLIAGYGGRIEVAAINSPESTAISGDAADVDDLVTRLTAKGVFARALRGDFAFHSRHMDPFIDELKQVLGGIRVTPASIALFSTVTGELNAGRRPGDCDSGYWARNMRDPVLFGPAIERMSGEEFPVFLEIGPHPVLTSDIQQALRKKGQKAFALPSLERGKDERQTLLGSLGHLHVLGYPVAWRELCPGGRPIPLPAYPWQRERFWLSSQAPVVSTQAAALPAIDGGKPSEPRREERKSESPSSACSERPDLASALVQSVATVLGYAPDRIERNRPLLGLGLDSLSAFRLKAQIEADLGVSIAVTELLRSASVEALAASVKARAAAASGGTAQAVGAAPPPVKTSVVDAIAATLGYSPDRVDLADSLVRLGIDSLLAFKLKARIDESLKISLPVSELLRNRSVKELIEKVEGLSGAIESDRR